MAAIEAARLCGDANVVRPQQSRSRSPGGTVSYDREFDRLGLPVGGSKAQERDLASAIAEEVVRRLGALGQTGNRDIDSLIALESKLEARLDMWMESLGRNAPGQHQKDVKAMPVRFEVPTQAPSRAEPGAGVGVIRPSSASGASDISPAPESSIATATAVGQLQLKEKARMSARSGSAETQHPVGSVVSCISDGNALYRRQRPRSNGSVVDMLSAEIRKEDYTERLKTLRDASMTFEPGGCIRDRIAALVATPYFDYFSVSVVLANSLMLGAQVHYSALTTEETNVFAITDVVFSTAFTLELTLRMLAYGLRSFKQYLYWTIFDIVLVLLSWMDIIMLASISDGQDLSAFKITRMARVLRVLRVLRFLGELRVMITLIVHSLRSLCWLLILLVAVLYFTAVIITQGATDYRLSPEAVSGEKIGQHFGDLFRTMYTLFKSMTGGVNWGEMADLLMLVSPWYFLIMIIYIFFMIFSVLNIVTGVFVDSAIQIAERDRGVLMSKAKLEREATISNLVFLLEEIDMDKNGSVSLEELTQSVVQGEAWAELAALGIDTRDVKTLANILDADGDGQIDIQEFVEGLQMLRGEARSFDIHLMLRELRNLSYAVNGYFVSIGYKPIRASYCSGAEQSNEIGAAAFGAP